MQPAFQQAKQNYPDKYYVFVATKEKALKRELEYKKIT
jgi:hypothetical protein